MCWCIWDSEGYLVGEFKTLDLALKYLECVVRSGEKYAIAYAESQF